MRLGRVRAGELLALAGAACIVVSLFERWYEGPAGTLDAWDTFGPAVVLLILAALAAIGLFVATLLERAPVIPVVVEVSTVPLALAATIAAIVRVLERPDGATSVCVGAWLALAGAVAVLVGAWYAMRDEHRGLYRPATPAPRPRP
jgi:uncharacterized membrane protein YiaA